MVNTILLIITTAAFTSAMHYREPEAAIVFTLFLVYAIRRVYRAIRQRVAE